MENQEKKADQYYQIIAHSTHFSSMQEKAIRELISHFRLVSWKKGDIPFDEYDTLQKFYIILKGRVKTYQINEHTGNEYTIDILQKGDLFDIICLLDNKKHMVLTEALDDVEALVAPIYIVREAIMQHPEFNQTLFPYLGRSMRAYEEKATDLALLSTWARTLKLFVKHLNIQQPKSNLKLINNLSHADLASIIGSARNVLNRHLQKLKKDKIIEIERSHIYIKDAQALIEKYHTKS